MVRELSSVPQTVIKKMRYTVPTQITDWKKRFSGGQVVTSPPPEKAQQKSSVKKTTVKRTVAKKTVPVVKSKTAQAAQPEPKSLVFIKKEPVTFQVRRLENPADFDRMLFVAKAASTDTRQKPLTVLHVEQTKDGSWLTATDGKRLHAAFVPVKIRSGDYKPVITKDVISLGEPVTGIMFPNWRRVIPGDTIERGIIDLSESGWGKDRNATEKLSVAFNAFSRQTRELVNLRYLEDLAKKKWAVHCQRERNRAIMLKACGVKYDMLAVIMPLAEDASVNAEAKAA